MSRRRSGEGLRRGAGLRCRNGVRLLAVHADAFSHGFDLMISSACPLRLRGLSSGFEAFCKDSSFTFGHLTSASVTPSSFAPFHSCEQVFFLYLLRPFRLRHLLRGLDEI